MENLHDENLHDDNLHDENVIWNIITLVILIELHSFVSRIFVLHSCLALISLTLLFCALLYQRTFARRFRRRAFVYRASVASPISRMPSGYPVGFYRVNTSLIANKHFWIMKLLKVALRKVESKNKPRFTQLFSLFNWMIKIIRIISSYLSKQTLRR